MIIRIVTNRLLCVLVIASVSLFSIATGCSKSSVAATSESEASDDSNGDPWQQPPSSSLNKKSGSTKSSGKKWTPPAPLDSKRAFGYLESICKIGPRVSGTPGMLQQQKLIEDHFNKLGGKVLNQRFERAHPISGEPVAFNNIVVQWRPELTDRVLIASHYDTRPFPDRDPKNRQGVFIGANDGGSSTALLMEMGHAMKDLELNVGVDFIFFDGEELVYGDNNQRVGDYFVGSTYFAEAYANNPKTFQYRGGILMDMIGDADLQIYYEENSFRFAKNIVKDVWNIAAKLDIDEFAPKVVHTVLDDHLPLNNIAGIPVIDIIDFNYPNASAGKGYWHTTADTPDKCSGDSMTKVGAVVLEWIRKQPKQQPRP